MAIPRRHLDLQLEERRARRTGNTKESKNLEKRKDLIDFGIELSRAQLQPESSRARTVPKLGQKTVDARKLEDFSFYNPLKTRVFGPAQCWVT